MKMRMILLIICFGVLSGCTVIINPVTDMVIKDSDGNIILNKSGNYYFGDQLIKTPITATFTIENNGLKTLELTGTPIIEISGPDTNSFSIVKTPDKTIHPGKSTTFIIEFTPVEATTHYIFVSISNSNENTNPYTFTVYGEGITPTLRVMQNSTFIPPNTGVYDFGNVNIDGSSRLSIFTIENASTGNLYLAGTPKIIISGADKTLFTIDETSTVSTIVPGNSTTFEITFKPTTTGDKSATISIESNDIGNNPYVFTIKGTGIAEPEINIQDSLTSENIQSGSGTYDFGVQLVNTVNPNSFTIQNIGNARLDLSGSPRIEITGTDASAFSVSSQPSSQIAPGYSSTFTIEYTPTTNKSYIATVSIENNDSDENPYTFTITGRCGMYGWTKQFGGSLVEWAINATTDYNGNIYITGCFEDSVDFAADFGSSDIKTSIGRRDAFITKINSNNTYAWTKCFGGSLDEYGNAVVTDSAGNVYLTGTFYNDTVDFGKDFGATDIKTSNGSNDIFITKITSNGSYVWTKRIGGLYSDQGLSISTDSADNIFIVGLFSDTVYFGSDFGVTDKKTAYNVNNCDAYILKINANGTYAWTKQLSCSGNVICRSVINDKYGNIFVVGTFKGIADFGADFSVSDVKTHVGLEDIFVSKINSNGTYAWTKQIGGSSIDVGQSIALDSYGNIYLSGMFKTTVNFAADFGSNDTKTCLGYYDIFVTKINANSTYGWTRVFGSTGYDATSESGLLLLSGNIYITGSYDTRADFGTDFGTTDVKVSKGEYDAYIVKMTDSGNYCWTKSIGGLLDEAAHAIVNDPSGNIYVVGGFSGTVDFGADFGVSDSKTSAGYTDVFITKLLH